MFSNDLASWKGRVKRAIEAEEPLSKILEENPTLTEEEFEKFKDTCATEAAKAKAVKFRSHQQRNTGSIASEAVSTSVKGPYGIRRTRNVKLRVSQTPSRSSPTPWSVTSSGSTTSGTRKIRFLHRLDHEEID